MLAPLFFYMYFIPKSKTALWEPKVQKNYIKMDKLNECPNLMHRLCNLPSNEDELRKIYSDGEIDNICQTIS